MEKQQGAVIVWRGFGFSLYFSSSRFVGFLFYYLLQFYLLHSNNSNSVLRTLPALVNLLYTLCTIKRNLSRIFSTLLLCFYNSCASFFSGLFTCLFICLFSFFPLFLMHQQNISIIYPVHNILYHSVDLRCTMQFRSFYLNDPSGGRLGLVWSVSF